MFDIIIFSFLRNIPVIQSRFLNVAVIYLKNCSKDDNHKPTHTKILLEIFVLQVYLYGIILLLVQFMMSMCTFIHYKLNKHMVASRWCNPLDYCR